MPAAVACSASPWTNSPSWLAVVTLFGAKELTAVLERLWAQEDAGDLKNLISLRMGRNPASCSHDVINNVTEIVKHAKHRLVAAVFDFDVVAGWLPSAWPSESRATLPIAIHPRVNGRKRGGDHPSRIPRPISWKWPVQLPVTVHRARRAQSGPIAQRGKRPWRSRGRTHGP